MKTKILVAALVCLSVGAVAQQSSSGQTKTTAVTAPSDAANGKMTGKKGYDYYKSKSDMPAKGATGTDGNAGQATALRESPSKATLKVAADEQATAVRESPTKSHLRESPTKSNVSVSAGDVNGDGKADQTAAGQSNGSGQNAAINTSHSNIKSGRDLATGQASGKRQHQPLSVIKEVEAAPKK